MQGVTASPPRRFTLYTAYEMSGKAAAPGRLGELRPLRGDASRVAQVGEGGGESGAQPPRRCLPILPLETGI